ncbi:hypothetical protein AVEN_185814-1 [Araneus ventricosus]|uniref:Uncharacterized protein n=1 Tax=Araneus ventricosus TaxID=182803 RepID=A0A4Y2TZV4_ARAVE|nr:hypothetical protein AVEN_185814-1 [Araneus ventricosus]
MCKHFQTNSCLLWQPAAKQPWAEEIWRLLKSQKLVGLAWLPHLNSKIKYLQLCNLRRGPSNFCGGGRVKRKRVLKYLGVFIREKINCAHHLRRKEGKAMQHHGSLLKVAGNTWGLSQELRS